MKYTKIISKAQHLLEGARNHCRKQSTHIFNFGDTSFKKDVFTILEICNSMQKQINNDKLIDFSKEELSGTSEKGELSGFIFHIEQACIKLKKGIDEYGKNQSGMANFIGFSVYVLEPVEKDLEDATVEINLIHLYCTRQEKIYKNIRENFF